MNRTVALALGGAAIVLCLCLPLAACAGLTVVGAINPNPIARSGGGPAIDSGGLLGNLVGPTATADEFMRALRDKDDAKAWELLGDEVRPARHQQLTADMDRTGARPVSWGAWSLDQSTQNGITTATLASGNVRYADGTSGNVELRVQTVDGKLRIVRWTFKEA
jgi:hypothetical protein